jgi:branched-chain amino acid transport system permease protein
MFGGDIAGILLGGLAAGMVLFIISVGLSVTLGLMGFVNLAHGAFAMIGGYIIIGAMDAWGVPFAAALVLGFFAVAALSIPVERLIYRPLYGAPELYQVLLTIGLIFVIVAVITLLVGPTSITIRLPPSLSASAQTDLGFISYSTYRLFLIAFGAVLMLLLWFGFERTRLGARIRAAVDNRRMAESVGINVGLLFTLTFALGSGLAGLGAALSAGFLGGIDTQFPFRYLVLFLIAVAIGGLGRIHGVFVASLVIGTLDFALKLEFPKGGTVFVFVLTILLLLWRPQGLFGKA